MSTTGCGSSVRPPDWRNPAPADRYNLVVLGAGTAGLVAAAGAAGLGARVALVERGLMGGDCLNTGCVPSKALLASARRIADARAASRIGVAVDPPADFAAAMERMRKSSRRDRRERLGGPVPRPRRRRVPWRRPIRGPGRRRGRRRPASLRARGDRHGRAPRRPRRPRTRRGRPPDQRDRFRPDRSPRPPRGPGSGIGRDASWRRPSRASGRASS